jgi:hypothetical protein
MNTPSSSQPDGGGMQRYWNGTIWMALGGMGFTPTATHTLTEEAKKEHPHVHTAGGGERL